MQVKCSECGSSCSYIIVNGLTVSVCSVCCQAVIDDTNIIIRLNEEKIKSIPVITREFVAVALAMQMMYQQWDLISKHVPVTE